MSATASVGFEGRLPLMLTGGEQTGGLMLLSWVVVGFALMAVEAGPQPQCATLIRFRVHRLEPQSSTAEISDLQRRFCMYLIDNYYP